MHASHVDLSCREGLEVLLANGEVFQCRNDRFDAIWYAELGASLALLEQGYNLASFLVRYDALINDQRS